MAIAACPVTLSLGSGQAAAGLPRWDVWDMAGERVGGRAGIRTGNRAVHAVLGRARRVALLSGRIARNGLSQGRRGADDSRPSENATGDQVQQADGAHLSMVGRSALDWAGLPAVTAIEGFAQCRLAAFQSAAGSGRRYTPISNFRDEETRWAW